MFNELSSSVGSVFKERIVSPLFGTLIISWSAWNWRLLYYLLAVDSNVDVQHRFAYIDQHFFNFSSLDSIIRIFIGPVLISALWLWFYPVLSSKIETYLAQKRAAKLRLIQEIDKTIPLTHEEAMAIYEKAEKQEERYAKLSRENMESIAKLNMENEELRNRRDRLEESERHYQTEHATVLEEVQACIAENKTLRIERENLTLELRKASFGKWADNERLIEKYYELKQNLSFEKFFTTVTNLPDLKYGEEIKLVCDKNILSDLMDKGIIRSMGTGSTEFATVELTTEGWQLLTLHSFRQKLESLLTTSNRVFFDTASVVAL